jgi:hypothetical protein
LLSENNPVSKKLWDYLGQHPEQVFVLKALGLVTLIIIFKDVFSPWWFTILLFSPVFIWQLTGPQALRPAPA